MNLEEMMIFYVAFALSGAVVTFTAIFMPALKYLRLHDNSNVVLRSWYTIFFAGILFFIGCIILGVFNLLILWNREAFLTNFINGLMGKE